jgi:hypothetical protein
MTQTSKRLHVNLSAAFNCWRCDGWGTAVVAGKLRLCKRCQLSVGTETYMLPASTLWRPR